MGLFNFKKERNEEEKDILIESNEIEEKIVSLKEEYGEEKYNAIKQVFEKNNLHDDEFMNELIIINYENDFDNQLNRINVIEEYAKYYQSLNNSDLKMLKQIILISFKNEIYSNLIIQMFMFTENKILTLNLIANLNKYVNISSRNGDNILRDLYKYFIKSKNYFVNEYAQYSRLELFLEEISINEFSFDETLKKYLEIDMRNAGIYNVDVVELENLENRLDNIKKLANEQNTLLKNEIEKSKSNIQTLDDNFKVIIDNLNKESSKNKKHAEYYKNEVESLAKHYIDKINELLGINPTQKEKLIEELRKCESVIKFFDPKIPFNERLDMALQNKDKNKFYDKNFDEVLEYIMMGQSVWLAGPTRCGKTTIAEGIADVLGLRYHNVGRIHDFIVQIKGYKDFNSNYIKSMFQEYFENGGLISLEEADLSDSQSLAELDHIVDNIGYKKYAFGDNMIVTPNQNFRLIATGNTRGMEDEDGYVRNLQDKSVMNRFMIVDMDYNEELEKTMLNKDLELAEFLHQIRKIEREIKKSDSFAKTIDITTGEFKIIQEHIKNNRLNIERIMSRLLIKDLPNDYLTKLISQLEQNSNNKYIPTFKELVKKR